MSFESAVRVNRISYGQGERFDPRERNGRETRGPRSKSSGKQQVDISEDTLLKAARAKLGRLVERKHGYDQRGAIASESPVGSLLSTKA